MRFTQDVPDAQGILPYYQSETYISHTNTSKGLINGLYQFIRRITTRRKRKLIRRYTGKRRGDLLDLGSGTGNFARAMKVAGWKVTGLEPDREARAIARQLNDIELDDIERFYEMHAASFDAITLWHVLEHVHELHPYVQQLKKLLKPDGRLFIAVPNYRSKDAAVYGEYWAAYDVPRHLYHFSPASMEFLLRQNGLRLEKVKPMWYDSFYISLLSSKYKHGKANLFTAGWNGLTSNFNALRDTRRCSSVIYIVSK